MKNLKDVSAQPIHLLSIIIVAIDASKIIFIVSRTSYASHALTIPSTIVLLIVVRAISSMVFFGIINLVSNAIILNISIS